ncbi:MAG: UvrD-helicase domain-containing protein, partial [Symbiobacteriaceae bacterium]|nr:UvrD-helicase domain-containing protein [Symbiobacteriaceae bacterium]
MDMEASLNPQQQEAVEYCHGPVLILAGAGSGKTRVLIHRIAWLLHQGIAPERILAITFTNKAAAEMRYRATEMVGARAGRLWVFTFHATCVRILRRHIDLLGYKSSFSIIDAGDAERTTRGIIRNLGLDDKIYTPGAVYAIIDRAKNSMQTPEELASAAIDHYSRNVARIYQEYQQLLQRNNSLDFNDLINLTVILFTRHPEVLRNYQEQFQYIMVDEY